MKYARESYDEVVNEIQPLLIKHWQEIAHYPDIPLDPDYAIYQGMDKSGKLRIFTARDSGGLVGYAIFWIGPALHYRGSTQATPDILFIDPTRRRGLGVAKALITYCESELAAEGAQVVFQRTKAKHNFGNLLEALGYELVDLVYARRLDRGSNIHSSR